MLKNLVQTKLINNPKLFILILLVFIFENLANEFYCFFRIIIKTQNMIMDIKKVNLGHENIPTTVREGIQNS